MPTVQIVETYPLRATTLFRFFARPANVLAVAPPGSGLRLVEGPDSVSPGATFTVVVRRWGLSQTIVTEVVEWQANTLVVEEQRRGPFARWRLERRFRAISATESELTESIECEPPGGLLGLTLTAARIEAELRTAYEGRRERVLGLATPTA